MIDGEIRVFETEDGRIALVDGNYPGAPTVIVTREEYEAALVEDGEEPCPTTDEN